MKYSGPIITYLAVIHLLNLLFQTVFRYVFYWVNVPVTTQNADLVSEAFLRGVHFDNVIACYIMALPLLLWAVAIIWGRWCRCLANFTTAFFVLFNSLLFAVWAVDIRYFSHFDTHLDVSALEWFRFAGTTTGMIVENSYNFVFLALFVVVVALFAFCVIRLGRWLKNTLTHNDKKQSTFRYATPKRGRKQYTTATILSLVLMGLCFLGIRGTFAVHPIRVSNAFFATDNRINQLVINPVFYFIKNMQYANKQGSNINNLMSEQEAFSIVCNSLIFNNLKMGGVNRGVHFQLPAIRPNIVVVLMESMAAYNLTVKHEGKPITPELLKLSNESYTFSNFYSAGIHTNNGIVATLYAMPTQFNKQMMRTTDMWTLQGLPSELKRLGYNTSFFITGSPHYDDMNGILRANRIDDVYSIDDYPQSEKVNIWGVPDEYLFHYGIQKLNEKAAAGQPFMATFLTASNHEPYFFTPDFNSKGANDPQRAIAYADYAVGKFIAEAKKQSWYRNTIFVLLGDHGKPLHNPKGYEMDLTYNHVPLIIHSPLLADAPRKIDGFGGQIDVFPTVMGLINQPYTNQTLGVDLLREKRPAMFFVDDTHLAVIDSSYLYIRNIVTEKDMLHNLKRDDATNEFSANHPQGTKLKQYGVAMTVAAYHLLKKASVCKKRKR